MKTIIRLAPIFLLVWAGFIFGSLVHATNVSNRAQQPNPFVGVWEPVKDGNNEIFIESLWIDEDNTWAAKMNGGRPDQKGTYTIKDGRLLLESEELKQHRGALEGTITQDGRLKVTELSRGEPADSALYFVKK